MNNDLSDLTDLFSKQEEEGEEIEFSSRPELLLHPNLPKPLHNLAPRTVKGKVWWDIERRKAYAKHNYHCMACGVFAPYNIVKQRFETKDRQLDAHEHYDIDYSNCTAELVEIVALCHLCHSYIHSGRVNALFSKGVIDEEDCWYVFTHGDSVLLDCGINPNIKTVDRNTYKGTWLQWRLILEGEKYKSKFGSFDEWRRYYKCR